MADFSPSSSHFTPKKSGTIFYSVFVDSCVSVAELLTFHISVREVFDGFYYVWQHGPINISLTDTPVPHLSGHLRFGHSLEEKWFVVSLLFKVSEKFPHSCIRVWDSDVGEFLLSECASHLPKWLTLDSSNTRLFIRRGRLRIVPQSIETPSLEASLQFFSNEDGDDSVASDAAQLQLKKKIVAVYWDPLRYFEKPRAIVPASVALVMRDVPFLLYPSIEGFYDRNTEEMMMYAEKMERFLPMGKEEKMEEISVTPVSDVICDQLVRQNFSAPNCYPMPDKNCIAKYKKAELGMKIACGMEMMYQSKKRQGGAGEDHRRSSFEVLVGNLDSMGYFNGILPGSKKYEEIYSAADKYYRDLSWHKTTRFRETVSAAVEKIDKILPLPATAEVFKKQDSSPSSSLINPKHSLPPVGTLCCAFFLDSCLSDKVLSLYSEILDSFPAAQHRTRLRFGDNLVDKWLVVNSLFNITNRFPNLSVRIWDSDGEFLLKECASDLPEGLTPETSTNRIFVRGGYLHILPQSTFPETPNLVDALQFLADGGAAAPDPVQEHFNNKLDGYNYNWYAYREMKTVRAILPVSVAWVMRQEPHLLSPSIEMHEKLVQQKFQTPDCYPMPERSDVDKYEKAEIGMKIVCGMEMMLKGGARIYYSDLHKYGIIRSNDVLSAPVKCIDNILALQPTAEEFANLDKPKEEKEQGPKEDG
ncbi:hypothetical protein C2S51_025174 [Perilla frutescens var. frutescens]|nr:hypothetical protein C2S51_025174 [Perilla frutescens var. frutescens]